MKITPLQLDPAAVDAAEAAVAAYTLDLGLGSNVGDRRAIAREVIATYLNHVYEDDEAMRRADRAFGHVVGRGPTRLRAAFLAAVRGGAA